MRYRVLENVPDTFFLRQKPFKDVKTGQGNVGCLMQNKCLYDANTASKNKRYGGSMVCFPQWRSGRA